MGEGGEKEGGKGVGVGQMNWLFLANDAIPKVRQAYIRLLMRHCALVFNEGAVVV